MSDNTTPDSGTPAAPRASGTPSGPLPQADAPPIPPAAQPQSEAGAAQYAGPVQYPSTSTTITAPPADPGLRAGKVKPERNILGIIALAVAVIGFIFACIPGALIVGWVLLPIGFILGIVAVVLKDKVKWQGIAAIIVSIVGTIVGFLVFFAVVATSFDDAFGGSEVELQPAEESAVAEEAAPPAAEEETSAADESATGTRENPAPLGTAIEGGDWTVVVNSVQLGATDAVLAANSLNEPPDAGTEHIVINYTVTYTGDDPDGEVPAMVGVEYVTAAGVTVDGLDKLVVAPDEMDYLSTLYTGASATGNKALQVPTPADGVIAVRPGMIADKVFVAIQ